MSVRLHSVDAARAFFLLMGIPFHVGTIAIFSINPPQTDMGQSILISLFLSVSHAFRMFAFFMLSGYFAGLIIEKRGRRAWINDRLKRLGIPLGVSLMTVGAIQYYLQHRLLGNAVDGFLSFAINVGHLWFLFVLVALCLSLYAIPQSLLTRLKLAGEAVSLKGMSGIYLLVFLGAWGLMIAMFNVLQRGGPVPTGLWLFMCYLQYLPAFVIGVVAVSSNLREQMFSMAGPLIVLATIALFVIYVPLDTVFRPAIGITEPKSFAEKLLSNAIEQPLGFLASICVFGLLSKLITRNFHTISFMTEGAMAIYLFHLPWTLVIVYYSQFFPEVPPELRWLVASLAVTALSTLCFLVVRQSRILSAAFSGKFTQPRKIALSA